MKPQPGPTEAPSPHAGLSDEQLLERLIDGEQARAELTRRPGPIAPFGDGQSAEPAGAATPAGSAGPEDKRDTRGRFVKGHRGGPGNPHARKVAALRSAALQVVGPDEMREVFRGLLRRSLGGDNEATRILLCWTAGRPAEAVNPDTIDLQEVRQLLASPSLGALAAVGTGLLPPDVAATLLRVFQEMSAERDEQGRGPAGKVAALQAGLPEDLADIRKARQLNEARAQPKG